MSWRNEERQLIAAMLSGKGLSAAEIALAEAIQEPGMSVEAVAIIVRQKVNSVKNAMRYRGLFARTISARRQRSKERVK